MQVAISGPPLVYPTGVRVDDFGDVLVADPIARRVVRVSGDVQTLQTELGALSYATDLEVIPVPEPCQLLHLAALSGLAC